MLCQVSGECSKPPDKKESVEFRKTQGFKGKESVHAHSTVSKE